MMTGSTHRLAICAALVLAACSRGGSEDPATVLERASSVAQQLQSAAFDASFSYDAGVTGLSVEGTAQGVLAEGGRQMSFSFDADVTSQEDGVDTTVSAAGDVVVAGENEAYIRLSRLDGSIPFLPGIGLVSEEALDTWFLSGSTSSGAVAVSPDPSFIALQTRILTVTQDKSYEEIDGRDCYAYDVEIDQRKAVEFLEDTARQRGEPFDRTAAETFVASYVARGTMWIDAETSVIRQIAWSFESAPGTGDMSASLTLHLGKHDEPVEITPPSAYSPLSDLLPAVSLPAL